MEIRFEVRLDLVGNRIDIATVDNIHEQLRVGAVLFLWRISQQEPGCTLADDRSHVGHAFDTLDVLFYFPDVCFGPLDPRALRQPVVDHELGTRRVREEALLQVSEPVYRCGEYADDNRHRHPARTNTAVQEATEQLVEFSAVGIFRLATALGRFQEHDAKQRRNRDRGYPAQH